MPGPVLRKIPARNGRGVVAAENLVCTVAAVAGGVHIHFQDRPAGDAQRVAGNRAVGKVRSVEELKGAAVDGRVAGVVDVRALKDHRAGAVHCQPGGSRKSPGNCCHAVAGQRKLVGAHRDTASERVAGGVIEQPRLCAPRAIGADDVKLPAQGSISMPVFALPLIVVPLMVSVFTSVRESGRVPVPKVLRRLPGSTSLQD